MTPEANMMIARRVLDKIKSTVTSSDDIIPRTELPVVLIPDMRLYLEKFGTEKMSEYMEHLRFSQKIRCGAGLTLVKQSLNELRRDGQPYPIATICFATTMMGVGECQETSNLAAILLCLYRCSSLVNIILVTGRKPITGESFEHCFVILGDCSRLRIGKFSSLIDDSSPFKQLGPDCVILDPLLSVVGEARNICLLEKERKYFDTFSINEIVSINIVNPRESEAASILRNAKRIHEKMHIAFGEPYRRSATLSGIDSAGISRLYSAAGSAPPAAPPASAAAHSSKHSAPSPK